MKFTEEKLELAFIESLGNEDFDYTSGAHIRNVGDNTLIEPKGSYSSASSEVLIKSDLKAFLFKKYKEEDITEEEANNIIRDLEKFPASDLYESNKAIMKKVSDGFVFKRDPSKSRAGDATKKDRKELDRQFKIENSNFKIAIVVDMWLTGFDVPFLDTMYIYKPIQRHTLIQTISRVNRKFEGKEKGLVVDYIGIKKQMNLALAHYNKADSQNFEDIQQSIVVVKDHLDLLGKIFLKFDKTQYFSGSALQQLETLNMAAEFVQVTRELEKRFMHLVKRLKAAYDICSGSDAFSHNPKKT